MGQLTESISNFADQCAARGWGALIVVERSDPLHSEFDGGIPIEHPVSEDLLLDIFAPSSELHQGAAIVRDNWVLLAGAMLPDSSDEHMSHIELGARAAIALTAQTDAVAIHVSPATSIISFANSGRLVRNLQPDKLRDVLSWLEW